VGHEETAAAPGGESVPEYPEFPAPRGAETAAPQRVPPQRPDADAPPAEREPEGEPEQDPAASADASESGTVPAQASSAPGLGARERAVLVFERRRWKHVGAKEQAIRDEFGISPTHYYQILNALLDDPAALAHSPALVNRLRRVRDARRRERR
jgi:Protein of unknown function (DUF3263)